MTTCLRSWKLPLKHKIGPAVRTQSSPLLFPNGGSSHERKPQSSAFHSTCFPFRLTSYEASLSPDKKVLCSKILLQSCHQHEVRHINSSFTLCNLPLGSCQEQPDSGNRDVKNLNEEDNKLRDDDQACSRMEQCDEVLVKDIPTLHHYQLESWRHNNTDNWAVMSHEKVPVAVFSGYLESNRYHVYCFSQDQKVRNLQPITLSLSELERQSILWADTNSPKQADNTQPSDGRPSEQQLAVVYDKLSTILPSFFTRNHDYSIYHKNIEFNNNIRGVTTRGLAAYVQQIALIKLLTNLRYAKANLHILKMTQHPEDGTIRVRWRIVGISGLRVMFFFWKFRVWEWKKMISENADWIDGFSVFYVDSKGLIYRHVCDKVIPDSERDTKSTNMAMKIALALGLAPRPDPSTAHFFTSHDLPITSDICS